MGKIGDKMKNREYIILHGLNGSPEGHWQHFLYDDLKKRGEKLFFPQFPKNDRPDLNIWIKYLDKFRNHIHENTVIIAHSMGVILWLHYIQKRANIRVKKCILVAPPSKDFLDKGDFTRSFSEFVLDRELFHKINKNSLLIATDNDQYCIPRAQVIFGKGLGIDYLPLPSEAKHINVSSGYGKWEKILELALNS